VLDADKEGYLRSATSLIQTMGRAARHVDGRVLLYADTMTESMKKAIAETERRRAIQGAHNEAHGITPQGIRKAIRDLGERLKAVAETRAGYEAGQPIPKEEVARLVKDLERQMKEAARSMEFERAALLRDQIYELRATLSDTDTPDTVLRGDGEGVAALAEEAANARAARAARSPSRYGGRRRR
jgi:excinuclease ABC subunit B